MFLKRLTNLKNVSVNGGIQADNVAKENYSGGGGQGWALTTFHRQNEKNERQSWGLSSKYRNIKESLENNFEIISCGIFY